MSCIGYGDKMAYHVLVIMSAACRCICGAQRQKRLHTHHSAALSAWKLWARHHWHFQVCSPCVHMLLVGCKMPLAWYTREWNVVASRTLSALPVDVLPCCVKCHMHRVGQNRLYTPYLTVYLVISLPKTLYTHRIYMVLANPTHAWYVQGCSYAASLTLSVCRPCVHTLL